jgi:hypothetical protein
LQAIDVGQHARNACTNQIMVIDHQHPNQADTSHMVDWMPPP